MYGGRKKMCCLPGDKGSTTARDQERRQSSSLSLRVRKGQGLQVCLKNTEV